jgi:hypothetical protein
MINVDLFREIVVTVITETVVTVITVISARLVPPRSPAPEGQRPARDAHIVGYYAPVAGAGAEEGLGIGVGLSLLLGLLVAFAIFTQQLFLGRTL